MNLKEKLGAQQTICHEQSHQFKQILKQETQQLKQWFKDEAFTQKTMEVGFELEFFLLDNNLKPKPNNLQFIESAGLDFLVPEVGAANLEINTDHNLIVDNALANCKSMIDDNWQLCQKHAAEEDSQIVMIGVPPTASEQCHLYNFMTDMNRYHIINENMRRYNQGEPITIDIRGEEALHIHPQSLAMDGLTASLQFHLCVPPEKTARYYNAAQIASAPVLALSGNSPYLFQRQLWEETRIAIFEQVMTLHSPNDPDGIRCCNFGDRYLTESLYELFLENLEYPLLFPIINTSKSIDPLFHLREQNGVIYRWNRPVIGFDKTGQPHLRIEHRSLPSGPSVHDMLANITLFIGLVHQLANDNISPETRLPFKDARNNFYQAAQYGLESNFIWFDGTSLAIQELFPDLLSLAQSGLEKLDLNKQDVNQYLEIIRARVSNNLSGSTWQRKFIEKNGADFTAMTSEYIKQQESDKVLSDWPI